MQAPWAIDCRVGCAASPTSVTRPLCQCRIGSRSASGQRRSRFIIASNAKGTGNYQSLGPRRINFTDDTPISGRDFIDQHVCRRVSWHLSDGNYDIVDAFDDLAPLILRERSFRYIDFGNWHAELLLTDT